MGALFISILQVRKRRPREVQSRGYSPVGRKWPAGTAVAVARGSGVVWPWAGPPAPGPWFPHLWRRWLGIPACVCTCADRGKRVCRMCVLPGAVARPQLGLGRLPSPGLSCLSSSCSDVRWGFWKENKAFPVYLLLPIEFTNHQLSE